jgi:hypothetical protein
MNFYSLNITRKGEQYPYVITPKDKLDLTRAVAREGKPYDAVAWSLLQRFGWLYPTGQYETLSEFIRAYAQPINPRWFPNGDKHLARIRNLKRKGASSTRIDEEEDRAERRVDFASATYDDIDNKYISLVDGILSGSITNPVKGAVHYIASMAPPNVSEDAARLSQKNYAKERTDLRNPIFVKSSQRGYNWFFDVSGSDKLGLAILEEMAPSKNFVNLGTKEDPVFAIVLFLYGAAAAKLAKELG